MPILLLYILFVAQKEKGTLSFNVQIKWFESPVHELGHVHLWYSPQVYCHPIYLLPRLPASSEFLIPASFPFSCDYSPLSTLYAATSVLISSDIYHQQKAIVHNRLFWMFGNNEEGLASHGRINNWNLNTREYCTFNSSSIPPREISYQHFLALGPNLPL